ncbi:MAG: ABC transporter ATP-binding protein [Planctomycetota bacterium]|nr:ABC transporter ATP-binding protein [Planctomycetota bacterium]
MEPRGDEARVPSSAAQTDTPPDEPRKATPTADDAAIRITGLTKVYDGKRALDSLDLEIRKGDIFGYIGPNGAGKTTTIRILAALLLPTSGRARILGVDVVRRPREIKRLVGYMPDSFGVYDNMTLGEYFDFFAAAYKIPRLRRKRVIGDVLELTDLGDKRRDLVSGFSRGMKQRACLAKTLLHNPQVLILDEPASGLDPRARIELRELLRELRNMGKTILVSSHILTELSTICNTIGIIEKGKLVAAGEVDTILKGLRTHREFTLELLESDACGRAKAWLEKRKGVHGVERVERSLAVTMDASDEEVAEMVEGLIAEKIRLVSVQEKIVDLETAFMTLTKGELA